ncbi:hypothetical protein [Prauserella shujinwangii]|uniref:hypothetical protein n=1 Tax=Prauserella shujinwangii TaxID=1453103 RepID=UPI001FECE217|nr:hypothetical protein [Prauserella shujinwangii]
MALGVLAGSATAASATFQEDPRAEIVDGNVDEGMKDACQKAGLDGEPIDKGDVDYTGGTQEDRFLTITGIPDGAEVTGIIVKGGDKYNLYVPGEKGLPEEPTWEKLRAPLNKGGQIPQISHWFLCGTVTTPTTSTTTGTSDTETTPPSSTVSSPETSTSTPTSGETSSSAPSTTATSGGGAVTTTSQPAVSPAGDTDDLASTGFGSGWLIGVGALLLAGGAALLVLARMRRRTTS